MEKKLWRKTKLTDPGYKEPISGIQDLLGCKVVEVPMYCPLHLHHISASGVYPTDLRFMLLEPSCP
ncbi:MAG: hypothetical protein BBJ57_10290 [Desulfobacterales bacterium PC51MH44]|nr:MAG: hypothetical protein BBJ57_10290 [Desulfobacterales bacterium PC51MH44]